MRSLGLGPKLMLILVGGALLLLLTMLTLSSLVLRRSADQARAEAIAALEEQVTVDLAIITQRAARLTRERLATLAGNGLTAARAIQVVENQGLAAGGPTVPISLTRQPDGSLVDTRPGRTTSLYAPPGASRSAVQRDAAVSAILNTLLPQQLLTTRNVHSVAYVGDSGVVRTYPAITTLTSSTYTAQLAILEMMRDSGARSERWLDPTLPPFTSPNSIDSLVVPLVTPIYAGEEFRGVIISYISLLQLTGDLLGLGPTSGGSAFLLDSQGRLVAAPDRSLPQLTSDPTMITGRQPLLTSSPELNQAIADMAAGDEKTRRIIHNGQPHLVSYAPAGGPGWSLGLLIPLEQLTISASRVSQVIRQTSSDGRVYVLGGGLAVVLLSLLLSLLLSRRMARPLVRLAAAAERLGQGDTIEELPVGGNDEVGRVSAAFNTMASAIAQQQAILAEQNQQLEAIVAERTAALQRTVGQLEAAVHERARLDDLLREVSVPVIRIARGVLLMPLIGTLDQERADAATNTLLAAIEHERASTVVLDVSGLPLIDTAAAAALLEASRAARLLGAETFIAGIRPEVAETLVALGINIGSLRPVANLETAMAEAVARQRSASRR